MKAKYILLTILISALSSKAYTATFIWTGNTSSSWSVSTNWSGGGTPGSGDNITINSNAPNNLVLDQNRTVTNFTINGDTLNLGLYMLTTTGVTYFNGGLVNNGNLNVSGSLCHFGGATIDARIDANCGYYHMNGGVFKKVCVLISSGTATSSGSGNCVFEDSLSITHSGTYYFTMGSTNGDNFENVTITNHSTHEFYLGTADSTFISGNLILNNTSSGGIVTGNTGGITYLASGKTISIGSSGFSNNYLTLKNFYQQGSTAQTLTLTGTAILNLINANFDGNLTVTSPGILLKNSTFNGTTTITRNGSSGNYHCEGNNIFSGPLSLDNAASAGRIRMASTTPDTYLDNVTLSSSGGMDLQIAYSGENFFHGNLTINSNKVVFNTASGKVTFSGDSIQILDGSYNFPFKKLAINKSGGFITANSTLSVDDTLFLIKGTFLTKSSNEFIFKLGSKVVGASDSSYVEGPVKKIGNTGFVFPCGAKNSYRPLEISAPSTTTSEFVAEFKDDSISVNTNTKDTTLARLLRKQYWNLNCTSGTSQVYVTLGWNSFSSLVDTIITVASWNGSQWKDLGKGILSGNVTAGNLKSNNVATSYSQFIIAFSGSTGVLIPPACQEIESAFNLQHCLLHSSLGRVTADIDLDGAGLTFPLEVPEGFLLTSSFKWWEPECPTITSNHKAVYDPNNDRPMFVFAMQPNSTIQNLRIRGADCNLVDFNTDDLYSAGIVIENDPGTIVIRNCEISCFSYAGIWKRNASESLLIQDSYIHKVKGHLLPAFGYGVWLQGILSASTPQAFVCYNTIFDDCKTAIDGQGDLIDWTIYKCSLSQFFRSEDINTHNDNRFHLYDGIDIFDDFHFCYSNNNANCSGKGFWGPSSSAAPDCNSSNIGSISYTENWMSFSDFPNGIPIYDIAGANALITYNIFHKKRTLDTGESGNGNINLHLPGSSTYQTNISYNTFVTQQYSQDELIQAHNFGGYAKLSKNNIDACIFQGDPKIITDDNSFEYVQGTPVSSGISPTPCEMDLELTDGSASLGETFTLSPYKGSKFIQYVNLNTDFEISTAPGVLGSQDLTFIIRPNPNKDVTTPINGVISEENYFYDGEIITDQATTEIPGYNKPGLYGIDVLGFDATPVGTVYDFKASAWQHIPVIVKGAAEKMLYFNIKDSYMKSGTTGVLKQVYLNELLIWQEDIGVGGTGWEYVSVNLAGMAQNGTTPILDSIHTDGSKNILSFSIYMNNGIDPADVAGVYVWVDDVYIPISGSINGDNLIEDGSLELSVDGLCETCYWDQILDDLAIGCGNTFAGISSLDKKSGSKSLYMAVPYEIDNCNYSGAIDEIVASVGTAIDFTDLLSCDDYWNGTSTNVGFELYPPATVLTTYAKRKFYIQNPITIVSSEILTFTGCDLVFEPGVEITVEDGGTLNIDYDLDLTIPANPIITPSHLFSCDEMWQGITVYPGGVFNVNGYLLGNDDNLCKIENAINAVNAESNGTTAGVPSISLNSVTFNNNLLPLYLSNDDFGSAFIGSCNFECKSEFLTKDPHKGDYPQNHILLEDVSDVNIGLGGVRLNKFNDVYSGIHSIRSSASITKSEFVKLKNNNITPAEKGIGIISENVTSTPCTLDVDSRFNLLHTGILTSGNINVNIHGSTRYFRDIDDIGISINSMNYNNDIVVNGIGSFQKNNIAIRIFGSNLNSVVVSNNTFTNEDFVETSTTSFHNTAITIQSPVNASRPNTVVEVFGNNITDYRIGIHANNISNINIGSQPNLTAPNIITFAQNSFNDFHHGIWLEGCDGAKVQDNEITQNSAAIPSGSYTVEGITIDECKSAFINLNEINELHTPIHVIGTCDDTELHCNDIINNTNAGSGVFLDLAKLPEQGDAANNISWDNTWEGYGGSVYGVIGSVITQLDWPWDNSDQKYNPNPDPNSGLISATPLTGPTSFGCAVAAAPDDPDRDLRYGPVVDDTLSFVDFEQEFTYKSKQYLFNLIQADSSLLVKYTSKDTLFSNFKINIAQTNIGKFYKVDSLMAVGDLAAAETLNSSLTDTNQIETNLKTVNGLLINKVRRDSILSSSDTLTLEEIAWQNPITGGKAVFIARALLFLEIHSENYAARIGLMDIPAQIDKNIVLNHFTLAPNPANSLCSVYFENMKSDFILSVKNILGQTLFETKVSANTHSIEIPIASFDEGIYLVTINDNIKTNELKKLIIVR